MNDTEVFLRKKVEKMESFTLHFATIYDLWEKTFQAKNQFDAVNQGKKYARMYVELLDTKVYFSVKNGNRVYCVSKEDFDFDSNNNQVSV